MVVGKNFKVFNKEVSSEKNFWIIKASHDAYSRSNGVIHERKLQYFHDNCILNGCDKLIKTKNFKNGETLMNLEQTFYVVFAWCLTVHCFALRNNFLSH